MAIKSVLILTAGFGEGHNAASRNLAAALTELGISSEVHDVFAEAYGPLNRMVQRGYVLAINYTPIVWKIVFDLMDRTPLVSGGISVFARAAKVLRRHIDRMKPDIVVSTYPGCGHLLETLYPAGKERPFRTVTVITDSLTINASWHTCHSDHFILPNTETATVLRRIGIAEERLHVTGFPVPMLFAEPNPTRQVPSAGDPWRVLYMVNSGHHTAPAIVEKLLTLPQIRLEVTVGHNVALGKKLTTLAAEKGIPLAVHGWVPNISELIRRNHVLISKAGGATVQEALAARTPMIITQIVPGQEEGNARLLTEASAGMVAQGPEAILAAVQTVCSAKAYLAFCDAIAPLSHPSAARDGAMLLQSLRP